MPTEEVDAILNAATDATPLTGAPAQPQVQTASNPFAPALQPGADMNEDLVSQTNQFMLDYGMDEAASESLIKWMQDPNSPLTQRDVVKDSLYHTLVMAKVKYDAAKTAEKNVKAKAIASIGKTQREAAKAAGALGGKSSPSPPADKPLDWTKLNTEERAKAIDIGELFRQVAGS